MPRLIDANEALEKVHNQGIAHPSAYHLTSYATIILREAPTVDAVEVVRCKECKHAYINSFSAASGVALCTLLTKSTEGIQIIMQQDDFCSYGERKESANNV